MSEPNAMRFFEQAAARKAKRDAERKAAKEINPNRTKADVTRKNRNRRFNTKLGGARK